MIIENRTVVSLNYRLTVEESGIETEVEQTDALNPFVFLYGSNNVLPAFEENLAGKTTGDKFDFTSRPKGYYFCNVVLLNKWQHSVNIMT